MAISSFAPGNSAFLNVGTVSGNVTIPSGGSIALVTNLSEVPVFVAMGTTSAIAATVQADLPVMPGQQSALTIGSNTTLAAVALRGLAGVVITAGS